MLAWKRPEPHEDFHYDAALLLSELREDVAKREGQPHTNDFKNREIWTASWQRGKQPPGLHKTALVGADPWFSKCVWCEQLRAWKRELDVEHYRPKVKVTQWALNPPIVSDVPPAEVNVGPGYWWLAFRWTNYSLACKPCNQGWKRNLFPVAEPRQACTEGVESTEKPLLLDPASPFRTRDHFRWTFNGIVEPSSPEGYATIVTCGLNRRALTIRREKTASKTSEILNRLKQALRSHNRTGQDDAFKRLAELGSRSEEFTSMVRWLVEECLGCSWDALEGMPL